MNTRERYHAICSFEAVDVVPLFRFQGCVGGFYPELVTRYSVPSGLDIRRGGVNDNNVVIVAAGEMYLLNKCE